MGLIFRMLSLKVACWSNYLSALSRWLFHIFDGHQDLSNFQESKWLANNLKLYRIRYLLCHIMLTSPTYFIQNIISFSICPLLCVYRLSIIDCSITSKWFSHQYILLIRLQEVDSINLKISQNANRFVRIAGSKRILTVFIIYIKYLEKYNFEILFSFATLENSALVLPWNGG